MPAAANVADSRTPDQAHMIATQTQKSRGRCVWWLCGRCRGGADCRCIPLPRSETANTRELTTVVDNPENETVTDERTSEAAAALRDELDEDQ